MTGDPYAQFDSVDVVGNGFNYLDGNEQPHLSEGEKAQVLDDVAEAEREEQLNAFREVVSDQKFRDSFTWLLGAMGRRFDLQSLQTARSGEEWDHACELLYDRLVSGGGGSLLKWLGQKNSKDALVLALGFGPLGAAALVEILGKRKATRAKAVVPTPGDAAASDDGIEENDG